MNVLFDERTQPVALYDNNEANEVSYSTWFILPLESPEKHANKDLHTHLFDLCGASLQSRVLVNPEV